MVAISYNATIKMQRLDPNDPHYGQYTEIEHHALFNCKHNILMARDFLFGKNKIEDPVGNFGDRVDVPEKGQQRRSKSGTNLSFIG